MPTTAFGDLATASVTPLIQIQFPYNINTAEITTSILGSGTINFSQPFAVCNTTAAASSSAALSTLANIHYQTGQGVSTIFTAIFTTGVTGSEQIAGAGNTQDGLFFGYNGATFGINRRYNGTDNWTAQTSWNNDPFNGTGASGITLIPTNGNVYKIQMQWLGFGAINFFIENALTGQFVLVHRIQYPNANTTTSLLQPSFPLTIQSINTTNTSNIVLKSASMSTFLEGNPIISGLNYSTKGSKSLTTTQAAVFTIMNNTTFAGITNKKSVTLSSLSLCSGATVQSFSLIYNTTLGGTPSYTNIATNNSVVSFDTAGTTVTGGRSLVTYTLNSTSNTYIDLTDIDFVMNPGDILTIAGLNASGGAQTAYCAINWIERF